MQGLEQVTTNAELASLNGVFRERLTERRERLESAIALTDNDFEFTSLLGQVDAALAKLDNGTYGKCEECGDYLATDRLLADPLVRLCLDDLSEPQKRSLESDLELAATIQRAFLPGMSFGHGSWKTDFVYEPLGHVSGDYCDVIPVDDELYFILGDVSGKGMAASLLMSSLHAIFHTLVPLKLDICELMTRANNLLVKSSLSNQFVTLICGKADDQGELELVNAGHLPPILIKKGVKGELNFSGLPLGMFAETSFSASKIKLDQGDSLLLFTDGVTETVNADGTEFGVRGLFDSIDGEGAFTPSDLIKKCLDGVAGHRGTAEKNDDLTVLALTYA
ncbi:MAG: SpoIIE family protein phosphatase [Acidobacteriota bacterium]